MRTLSNRSPLIPFAVCLLVATFFGTPVSAQSEHALSWGTGNTHVLNMLAINFNGPDTPHAGEDYYAYYVYEYAAHGVDLPSGSKVVRLEAVGCDAYADLGLHLAVYFRDCEIGASPAVCVTWPTEDGITTIGDPGWCGTFGADFDGPTIDNESRVYLAEFKSPVATPNIRIQLVRIFYELQVSPAPAIATFADVPVGAFAFQHIEALAASGITAGCGGGDYCPDAPVTRAQMAVFLSKALGLYWAP